MRRLLLLIILLACTLAFIWADARQKTQASRPLYASDLVKIKLSPEAITRGNLPQGLYAESQSFGINELDQLMSITGGTKLIRAHRRVNDRDWEQRTGFERWFLIQLDGRTDVQSAIASFKQNRYIEDAIPEYIAYTTAVPNDTYYANNWGHNNTAQLPVYQSGSHSGPGVGTIGWDSDAQLAWDGTQGYGSSSIVIAIIDTGVDTGHPDLRLVTGYDYGDNDPNPMDDSSDPGHGTSCSGVAAGRANNSLGVTGIAGGCSVMPLKVANSAGSMYFTPIENAITHAADNGADIISMSLGAEGGMGEGDSPSTDAALTYAYNAGVTIFAATANSNTSTIAYPSNHTAVISVGASSPTGERKSTTSSDGEYWWGSNYGTATPDDNDAVDIMAPTILPATDLVGTAGYNTSASPSGDYYMWFNGTSCATPYAAGVAALVKSKYPTLTPAQMREKLVSSCTDMTIDGGAGWDRYTGYGMVNANAALNDPAEISWSPTSFTQDLPPSGAASQSLTIGNVGESTLNYEVTKPDSNPIMLDETFATTTIPNGWTQQYVSGSVSWIFATGGNGGANPSTAYDGAYNARFYNGSAATTKLISPSINLSAAVSATLTFYHTQAERRQGANRFQDQLKVYYKTSLAGTWMQLAHYTTSITTWTLKTISLPNLSGTYYIAFEGIAASGHGVCVDKIMISAEMLPPTWLTIDGGDSASGSIVGGGADQTVSIGFDASGLSVGTYTSSLFLESNCGTNPSVTIPVTLNVVSMPGIVVNPTELDFGLVNVGESSQRQFTIQNPGSATLTGTITTPEGYTVALYTGREKSIQTHYRNALPYSVAVGNTSIFELTFAPLAGTDYNGNVVITHNSMGDDKLIAITGTGFQPLSVPFAEGFEDGLNGWITVNGSQINQWWLGGVTKNTGAQSIYVSRNSGLSNLYETGSPSVVHFYNDIVFPGDASEFILRFNWKGGGETGYDDLRVYLVDTSVTPQAGTELSSGQVGAAYLLSAGNWSQAEINLPTGLAGSSKRLVFSWRNNASTGTQPGAAVDDIRIVSASNSDAAVVIDGDLIITPPPVTDPESNPINPSVLVSDLSGDPDFIIVTTDYALPEVPYENAGLCIGFTGADLGGSTVHVDHNLGWIPTSVSYRIGAEGGWNLLQNPGSWTTTAVELTVPASKAGEDFLLAFPDSEDSTLPVTLSSFDAVISAQNLVRLDWVTQSESGALGYYLHRCVGESLSEAEQVSGLIEATNTSQAQYYSYTDREIQPGLTYNYWLQCLDLDGWTAYHGPVSITVPGSDGGVPPIPLATELHNAYPNPFNPSTTISYSINRPGKASLEIYNLKGQLLRTYVREHSSAGNYAIDFDGRDYTGKLLASGVYCYRFRSGDYEAVRKMVMSK